MLNATSDSSASCLSRRLIDERRANWEAKVRKFALLAHNFVEKLVQKERKFFNRSHFLTGPKEITFFCSKSVLFFEKIAKFRIYERKQSTFRVLKLLKI